MIAPLAAAAFAAAGLLLLLFFNGRAYVRRVEARWPAQGRLIEIGKARVHVREAGAADAPRVLLLHGANSNLRELWSPLAEPLSEDHCVIAIDRPGYGFSSRPRLAKKLETQARLAAGVLERAHGRGPAVIVGHSLGCAVALRLAIIRPDLVRGLVLIAPASHPYPKPNVWWARLAATPVLGPLFVHSFVPWLGPVMGRAGVANTFAPGKPPKDYYDDGGVGLAFRPKAFLASCRDVCATRAEFAAQAPKYGDILAPAIILTAEKDRVVSPKIHARALAVDMAAAELVIAPESGHMPHRLRTDLALAAIRRVEAMEAVAAAR